MHLRSFRPISALKTSLAGINEAFTTLIRRYIDKKDVVGSRTPAAPEAPIDNAIEGNNAAVAEIDRLEPKAKLSPTVFTPP